ncbi:uncharacterized protein LOC126815322 [Patella vulgata]|uniref:uncharacterized protein LOC126815322 n=1 Tax=Patella vulgata TaxID=6465 RepID=UPI00217F4A66|nr:uncharacterized protein LOC126815322 [Patella vulgata]
MYWNTEPYCYCRDLEWGTVDGIRSVPVGTGVAVIPGLSNEDTAILAGALIGLATLLSLLLCILCCLCPPGFCWPCCGGAAASSKTAAAAGGASSAAAAGAGGDSAGRLHEVDIKLPRAWVESFRGVPIEDFDAKLKSLEASGWYGLNDGYGSWFGDDANSMSTLLKGGGYGTGYRDNYGVDEVDASHTGHKKGHTRMGSAYLTSEEVFGTRHNVGTASAGDRAEKKREYEYGSVISAKYGSDLRGESEAELDRSTTTLVKNAQEPRPATNNTSGGVYNYGYTRDEEIRTSTTTTTSEPQQQQQQQHQQNVQQQSEVTATNNSGMNAISEMSMSSGYNTLTKDGTISRSGPMSSKVIYEATRETRTVTDESGNVSKTHSETKNGDGAKVLGVISKNGTFRRVKNGDVEFVTQDDISKDVKCLTRDNVMKLYHSYQRARSNNGTTSVTASQNIQDKDNVSL